MAQGAGADGRRQSIKAQFLDQVFSPDSQAASAANVPANSVKEPVATFSLGEIQEVRSSLFQTSTAEVFSNSPETEKERQYAEALAGETGRGLLRARLEDIIVDPSIVADVCLDPVAMAKHTVPSRLCRKILHVDESKRANRTTVGTLQGSPSMKAVNRSQASFGAEDDSKFCNPLASPVDNQGHIWLQRALKVDEDRKDWRHEGPQIDLREYVQSPEYLFICSGCVGQAGAGGARSGALRGVTTPQ